MKTSNLIVCMLCAATAAWAGAAERPCQDVPASGDPGNAGSGLTVTVRLSIPDEDDMELDFDVGVPCYTWSREAEGDRQDPEDGHLHYNAADKTAYADGTFRWTEYGPEHSQEAIERRCADQEDGVTKFATTSDLCEDHHELLLKVVKVSEP